MKVTFYAELNEYSETLEFDGDLTEHDIGQELRKWVKQSTPVDYWFKVEEQ